MKDILSAFDITGPIMIGPSSSHTAGACRMGCAAMRILGEPVKSVVFHLYGSFKETLKGHGTDKALIGGILGFSPSDERIRNAFAIARDRQVDFKFVNDHDDDEHPNTVFFDLVGVNGNRKAIKGVSIGGGNIIITQIDSTDLRITGKYYTLITEHWDQPGIVLQVSKILTKHHINIANMNLYRENKNDLAYMIIEADDLINEECVAEIKTIPDIKFTVAFDKLF